MRSFAFVLALLTAAPGAAAELILELLPASEPLRCEVAAVSVSSPSGKSAELPLTPPVILTSSAASIRVNVDAFPAEVVPVAKGCWAGRQLVSDSTIPLTVKMWPAATVLGGMSFEKKGEEPRQITGSFVSVSGDPVAEAVACSLESKLWRCSVPAGRPLHLKVSIGDFAPLFVWDVNVQPEAVQDTGIHTLVRGAAIAGRAVLERGRPAANANVALRLLTSGGQPPGDRSAKRLQTRTNASGYFQFTGLEPGLYSLASQVDGRGDAVLESIEVRAGEHLQLREPLVHVELAELAVLLQPPVSPSQKPWSVELLRDSGRDSEVVSVARGPASVDGYWSKAGLQPIEYLLRVSDAEGSQVVSRRIVLRGGPEQLTVDVVAIGVRGRVLAGEKGLAADVVFEYEGRRVKTTSDEDGAFNVDFPAAGSWTPSVTAGGGRVRLEPVQIASTQEEALILRIPGGGVRGKVLDAGGRPAGSALVALTRGIGQKSTAYADENGRFELIGVDPGEYTIYAEAGEGFGGPLPLTIREDETAEIDLRLDALKEVTGVVTSASGAAASGAVVRSFDPLTGLMEETIADGRGAFSFKVRPRSTTIDLIVLAPPYPIAMRQLSLGDRRVTSAHVQLAPAGTKLRVYILRSPPWPVLTGPDGVTRSLGLLLMPLFGRSSWREFVEGGFNFFLEPGPYVICGDGTPPCQQLQLAAHAETTVQFLGAPTKGTN
jgi:hypothetical protein